MKIAFLSQPMDGVLPPYQNSIGISTYEMARRLVEYCEVVVYQKGQGYCKKVNVVDGVQYRSIPSIYDTKLTKIYGKFGRKYQSKAPSFFSIMYYFFYALSIALDLRTQKCDIVQVYNFSQFVPIIRFFNPKIKIVLNMRCEWLTQIDRDLIENRLKHVNMITGCSDYITNKIRDVFPENSSKCRTIYNGVDVDGFSCSKSSAGKNVSGLKLLFVGRCSPEKGVHVLIEAFHNVLEYFPEIHLDIVGSHGKVPYEYLVELHKDDTKVYELKKFYKDHRPDSYYVYCKELADKLGIADKVHFLGGHPYEKMVSFYNQSDIVVNPSFSESFGRSLIEAMTCGKPVIASKVGGMTEIIENGKSGLLFESGNVSALANSILLCLNNESLRETMGKASRERVENTFSWDSVFTDLYAMFQELS